MVNIDVKKITDIKNWNKKKVILFAAGFIGLIAITELFLKTRALSGQLAQNKMMIKKMQEQAERLTQEKEAIGREKEDLQAGAISYLALNTSLEEDKDRLKQAVAKSNKALEDKDLELQKAKLDLKRYEDKLSRQDSEYKSKFLKESQELQDTVKNLEESLRRERGLYHYNLAVSYTQANLFDQAVDAYEKSLEIDPDNPEAHYNLGLLYVNVKNYPEKAVEHYRKYLQLKPGAEDREDVEDWIEGLDY